MRSGPRFFQGGLQRAWFGIAIGGPMTTAAHGQSIAGDVIRVDRGVGSLPTPTVLESFFVGPVVAGPGDALQIGGTVAFPHVLDVDPTRFTLTIAATSFSLSSGFNGYSLVDLDFPGQPGRRVTGARPVVLTNAGGFDARDLRITPDRIDVNLAGLVLNNTTIAVDVLSRVNPMLVGDVATVFRAVGTSPATATVSESTLTAPITDDSSDETRVGGTEAFPLTVDLDGERLTIRVSSTGFSPSQAFNGFIIDDLDFADLGRQVTGLTLVGATNAPGFDIGDLSVLDDGDVSVNFAGLSLNNATIVVDLQSTIVPEPAATMTLAMALTALCRRRTP